MSLPQQFKWSAPKLERSGTPCKDVLDTVMIKVSETSYGNAELTVKLDRLNQFKSQIFESRYYPQRSVRLPKAILNP